MGLPANLAFNDLIDETWVDAVTNGMALTDPAMLNLLKTALDSRYVPLLGGVVLTDAAQTITTSLVTDITWGTEVSDPDGWTAGGIATLTVPAGKGGRYLVTCSGVWSAAPTIGIVYATINGVAFQSNVADTVSFINTLTFLTTLAVADALKFRLFQTSGTNKDFVGRLEICPV